MTRVESPGGHGVGTLGSQEVLLRHDGGAGGGAGHLPVVVEVVIVRHSSDTEAEVAAGVDWAVVHTLVTRLRPLAWDEVITENILLDIYLTDIYPLTHLDIRQ